MPWKETCVEQERMRFVAAWLADDREMTELCREFGISRKTGYKWLDRYEEDGVAGLRDLRRSPRRCPHAVSDDVVQSILELRRKRPTWGPKKLRARLEKLDPEVSLPALSTIGDILKRHGLTAPRRRRRRMPPYQRPFLGVHEPNVTWSADFKGQFRTKDGTLCYPLTITDNHSRYLLRCQALTRANFEHTQPVFEAAFREFGLPAAIRTDNGPPFASVTISGLSRLSVWFIKLGIVPERIEPGHPEQNGRHERMHLTLKLETADPPQETFRDQQKAFQSFVHDYNHVRPHEALDLATPASTYVSSPRTMPPKAPHPTYPQGYAVRKVSTLGMAAFDRRSFVVSRALTGEHVGLREHVDGVWVVRFAFLDLGVVDLNEPGRHLRMKPLPPDLSWDAQQRLTVISPRRSPGSDDE